MMYIALPWAVPYLGRYLPMSSPASTRSTVDFVLHPPLYFRDCSNSCPPFVLPVYFFRLICAYNLSLSSLSFPLQCNFSSSEEHTPFLFDPFSFLVLISLVWAVAVEFIERMKTLSDS